MKISTILIILGSGIVTYYVYSKKLTKQSSSVTTTKTITNTTTNAYKEKIEPIIPKGDMEDFTLPRHYAMYKEAAKRPLNGGVKNLDLCYAIVRTYESEYEYEHDEARMHDIGEGLHNGTWYIDIYDNYGFKHRMDGTTNADHKYDDVQMGNMWESVFGG